MQDQKVVEEVKKIWLHSNLKPTSGLRMLLLYNNGGTTLQSLGILRRSCVLSEKQLLKQIFGRLGIS